MSSVSSSGRRSAASVVDGEACLAGLRVAVDDRELDLALAGVEIEEELVHLVHDLFDARVRTVDLVDDEDHRQQGLERLAEHEARLRERAFARVDEEQHAVDHPQPPLHLAAEVGMPRRVDDVDLRPAVVDGGVLGEDRDALLALEVHRVEHTLGDVLVHAERAGLPQHRVDERRLSVVDVGDDRDVPDVVALGHRPRVAVCRSADPGTTARAEHSRCEPTLTLSPAFADHSCMDTVLRGAYPRTTAVLP